MMQSLRSQTERIRSVVQLTMDKELNLFRHRGSDFHPVIQRWGFVAASSRISCYWNSCIIVLTWSNFLDPVTNTCGLDRGMIKWVHVQRGQWVDKKDAGLVHVNTHIHLYKETWVKEQMRRLKQMESEQLTTSSRFTQQILMAAETLSPWFSAAVPSPGPVWCSHKTKDYFILCSFHVWRSNSTGIRNLPAFFPSLWTGVCCLHSGTAPSITYSQI